MIPIDPVNLGNPAPFDAFSYYIHIIVGLVGLIAALAALAFKKGSPRHILAGRVFVGCILVVSTTSLILLSVRMAPPLLVAALTSLYAVGTAVLALRPISDRVRWAEYGLSLLLLSVVAIFLAMSIPHVLAGNIPPVGPIVILAIPLILLASDINFFRKASSREALRIRRHLVRMIWAFIIAVRAPLAEIYFYLNLPVVIILFGPLIIGPILIAYFLRRFPVNVGDA